MNVRTIGSMRLYSRDEIERLRFIKRLVEDLGINLAGVERILEENPVLVRPVTVQGAVIAPVPGNWPDPVASPSYWDPVASIFTSCQRWPLKIVGTWKPRIQGWTAYSSPQVTSPASIGARMPPGL